LPAGVMVTHISLSTKHNDTVSLSLASMDSKKLVEAYNILLKYNLIIHSETESKGLYKSSMSVSLKTSQDVMKTDNANNKDNKDNKDSIENKDRDKTVGPDKNQETNTKPSPVRSEDLRNPPNRQPPVRTEDLNSRGNDGRPLPVPSDNMGRNDQRSGITTIPPAKKVVRDENGRRIIERPPPPPKPEKKKSANDDGREKIENDSHKDSSDREK